MTDLDLALVAGVSYVKKRRDRGSAHVMVTAKELIREALPIQCVEAVFIGLYLTAELAGAESTICYPLSFKSRVAGMTYRHIVLAITHQGKWGALGISRCDKLQFKDLTFDSLGALITEYRTSYESVGHALLKVYLALPFSTDQSAGPIKWRALKLSVDHRSWAEIEEAANRFAKPGRGLTWPLPEGIVSGAKSTRTGTGDDDSEEEEGDQADDQPSRFPSRGNQASGAGSGAGRGDRKNRALFGV